VGTVQIEAPQVSARRTVMKTARLVRFLAAALITVVQWTTFLWLLEPAQVEGAPIAWTASDDALPVIVITAPRYR
jgi:hypothetical protein